jgi:hypothetical protein
MVKRRRPRIDGDVQAAIDALALKDWGATQIHKHLERQPDFRGRVPTPRTIQRRVSELTPRDSTGAWRAQEADPDNARLVLDVVAAVVVETMGEKTQFTKAEADRVLWVRKTAPSISPWEAWLIARLYMARDSGGEETTDLDSVLAFEPWQESRRGRQYFEAVRARWIPAAPEVLRTLLAGRMAEQERKEDDNDAQAR